MTAIETIHTHKISSFPLDVQAAYHLVQRHMGELLRRAEVDCQPVAHAGSYTFYTAEGNRALVKIVPWDSRMACLSDLEPVSQWGVSVWLRNECLTAEAMQALWEAYEGFYCPSPPNPVLVATPQCEKEFQVIRFCMDDGGINFLALPGASVIGVPPELRKVAGEFSGKYLPFDPAAWETMTSVLRQMSGKL